jgi:RNA polymerase sigma-70 factor (ECF subfamily)
MDARLAEEDDAGLARRVADAGRTRDVAAEAALCRRLGPRVRLFGLKNLRDEAAAKDLAQDVLMIVLEKLRDGAIRDPAQVASFALGTARQRVVDWRRGERRRERLRETYPVLPLRDDEMASEPIVSTHLVSCLEALPERERTVLVLTFYQERPAAAVAAELALSPGNVRVIRHRGLQRLRGCLESKEGAR